MSAIERSYVKVRGQHVHIRSAGAINGRQPPLIMLHPNPASGAVFEDLLADLGKDRRAIAVDSPGFGMSDPYPGTPSVNGVGAYIGELIDTLGFTQIDMFGAQTGARISVALTLERPALVRRLIMMSAPVWNAQERAESKSRYSGTQPQDSGQHLLTDWNRLWGGRYPELTAAELMKTFPDHARGIEHRDSMIFAVRDFPYDALIPKIEQPIMVLNPKDSLTAATKRVETLLKNGKLVNLDYGGYGMLHYKAADVARHIREFLAA